MGCGLKINFVDEWSLECAEFVVHASRANGAGGRALVNCIRRYDF